jgi:hypothetical protein
MSIKEERPITRFTQELRKEIIDQQTGEVIGGSVEKIGIVPKEPNFVKLYFNDIGLLNDLPKVSTGILYELVKRMDYNGEIMINMGIKKRIAKEINVSLGSIKNSISIYIKKKILFRIDEGIYKANAYIFGRGEWSDIRKIRLSIEYTPMGREVVVEVDKNQEVELEMAESLV